MSVGDYLIYSIFVLLGLISLLAAIFNFDWYFKTGSALTFIKWFGRTGARVAYFLLGVSLILCGVGGWLGWGS